MQNKHLIKKLRDNAELAWAAYGFFHLADKSYKPEKNNKDWKRLDYFRDLYKNKNPNSSRTNEQLQSIYPTPSDILNLKYKYFKDKNDKPQDSWYHNRLFDGDFSPIQAQRFFSRYDLLIHQPNTESGFSATLFGEKRKQIDSKTKKVSYTNKYGYVNYIFAIRGTKPDDNGDLKADARLALSSIPQGQYEDMLRFYNQCKTKYPAITKPKSLNIVGHSLGGALTQMLILSLCDDNNEANINEVYTFNPLSHSKKVA